MKDESRRRVLLQFATAVSIASPRLLVVVAATPEMTEQVRQDGVWDLRVENTISGRVDYWLKGSIILSDRVTEDS